MRATFSQRLEDGRIAGHGGTGHFRLQGPCGEKITIVSSERSVSDMAEGWDHVSVSVPRRTPNWREMSFVKDLFWPEDETVIQFHPKKSEYVNNHPHVLHLWQHVSGHKLPPSIMVGDKRVGELTMDEATALFLKFNPPT